MKDTLTENQATSWWFLRFVGENFQIIHMSLYVNLLKTMCSVSLIKRITVGYLKDCVASRMYLMPM